MYRLKAAVAIKASGTKNICLTSKSAYIFVFPIYSTSSKFCRILFQNTTQIQSMLTTSSVISLVQAVTTFLWVIAVASQLSSFFDTYPSSTLNLSSLSTQLPKRFFSNIKIISPPKYKSPMAFHHNLLFLKSV